MDHQKFNQVVSAVAAVVSWFEQINVSPGTRDAATDPANAFLCITVHQAHQKQFSSGWQDQQHAFSDLSQESISSPVQCPNLVHKNLDCFSLPHAITDDIMLTGPSE